MRIARCFLVVAVAATTAMALAAPPSSGAGRPTGGAGSDKPSSTPTKLATVAPKSATSARTSLLGGAGPKPSQRVTEIIRERESSGPGWIGTAFLVSMLSQHDLSSSDRSWIQSRIDAAQKRGESDPDAPALLPEARPPVVFAFEGIDSPLHVGWPSKLRVKAADRAGHALVVSCDAPTGAHAVQASGHAEIAWTPTSAGIFLLPCRAGTGVERRLVRVVTDGAS